MSRAHFERGAALVLALGISALISASLLLLQRAVQRMQQELVLEIRQGAERAALEHALSYYLMLAAGGDPVGPAPAGMQAKLETFPSGDTRLGVLTVTKRNTPERRVDATLRFAGAQLISGTQMHAPRPDWSILEALRHVPQRAHCPLDRSGASAEGALRSVRTCRLPSEAIRESIFVPGNGEAPDLQISSAAGSAIRLAVSGALHIETLTLSGSPGSRIEVIAAGDVEIGSVVIESSGLSVLIHSSSGYLSVQNLPPGSPTCELPGQNKLRLEARAVRIGERREAAVGCSLLRDAHVWPRAIVLGYRP